MSPVGAAPPCGCSIPVWCHARCALSEILVRMAEAVRTRIGADARLPTRRTLYERLLVRWPGLWPALARAAQILPPRSRVRRAGLRGAALSGWGAWVRGDLD